MNRMLGVVLIMGGVFVLVVGGAFLLIGMSGGDLSAGGAVLGFGLMTAIVVAPLILAGTVILIRGTREAKEDRASAEEAEGMRKILDMVEAKGKVNISDVIIEMQSSRSEVHAQVHKLVGMELFDGYINWDEGMLYSAEASALAELTQCYNCGGQITIAGKGIFVCPFCGTEYFLSKQGAQEGSSQKAQQGKET